MNSHRHCDEEDEYPCSPLSGGLLSLTITGLAVLLFAFQASVAYLDSHDPMSSLSGLFDTTYKPTTRLIGTLPLGMALTMPDPGLQNVLPGEAPAADKDSGNPPVYSDVAVSQISALVAWTRDRTLKDLGEAPQGWQQPALTEYEANWTLATLIPGLTDSELDELCQKYNLPKPVRPPERSGP